MADFKYNLNHYISLQPQWRTVDLIAGELAKEGISERTFYRDRAIRLGDDADIPAERLMIYARFFDVRIDDLFNYDTKVKPISVRIPSKEMRKVARKTGLKL